MARAAACPPRSRRWSGLIVLAVLPAFASAARIGQQPQRRRRRPPRPFCEATITGECTLRAAIEAANEDTDADEITFSTAIFNGVAGADRSNRRRPCPRSPTSHRHRPQPLRRRLSETSVGVTAPAERSDSRSNRDVAVEHVAFGGGSTGIEVVAGSTGFLAGGDWFGLQPRRRAPRRSRPPESSSDPAPTKRRSAARNTNANRNVFANAEVGSRSKAPRRRRSSATTSASDPLAPRRRGSRTGSGSSTH